MGVTVCEKDLRQSESSGSFTMCCGDADANGQHRIHVSQKQTEDRDAALQEAQLPIHCFLASFPLRDCLGLLSCIYLLCHPRANTHWACLAQEHPLKWLEVDCKHSDFSA